MGSEQVCTVRLGGETFRPKVLLETDRFIFRGELKLSIPFADVTSIDTREGTVAIVFGRRTVEIDVGSAAAKWVKAVKEPRTILDKLGVAAGQRISLVGFAKDAPSVPGEPPMLEWLRRRGADVSPRLRKGSDLILFAATRAQDLDELERLKVYLKPQGGIWIIRPKGVAAITERQVMSAAKAAGLVDVKVASFSPAHTAEKLVIPVGLRGTS